MVPLSAIRLAILWVATCAALEVDLKSPDAVKAAAKLVAQNLIGYYHGDEPGQIPGILPGPPPGGPYFWWEGGALWGTMVDYWHYTGDTTWNNITTQSLVFQSERTYQPLNWSLQLGNDDQGFWGMSVMLAAEVGYPDPPPDQPQWLALSQGVFNSMASRWEAPNSACGGGLIWQITPGNIGDDYKNTISAGILFNMGARLARYTHNDTYATWATKSWDWMEAVGFIDDKYNVYDGGHIQKNCTDITKAQWTYNAAVLTEGAAYMFAYTNGSQQWTTRLSGLVNRTLDFFFPEPAGVAIEIPCEQPDTISCKTDNFSFKGYLHRWLATSTQLAPYLADTIMAKLRTSAAGAARNCNPDGACGFRWTTQSSDGNVGAGQEMSVLAALLSVLVTEETVKTPLTSDTGGTSKGNPAAGNNIPPVTEPLAPITPADRAGAGIVTTIVLASFLGCLWWLVRD